MSKKYTTLSGQELALIENLIKQYGNIVDFAIICQQLDKQKSRQEIKNFVSNLVKKGWLMRVKRGVYIISDIASRGIIGLNQLTIAQIIDKNSYISFEAALQHYGLFDQYLRTISSIGLKKSYSKKFNDWLFQYFKAKNNSLAGYREFNMDGRLVKIATKEKAIIDFLIYKRSFGNIDLIIEKLKNYQNEFDIRQLIKLASGCTLTVKRSLGVILDSAGLDSARLYEAVKSNKNHSFMTAKNKAFNAKWRIYTEKYLEKYK